MSPHFTQQASTTLWQGTGCAPRYAFDLKIAFAPYEIGFQSSRLHAVTYEHWRCKLSSILSYQQFIIRVMKRTWSQLKQKKCAIYYRAVNLKSLIYTCQFRMSITVFIFNLSTHDKRKLKLGEQESISMYAASWWVTFPSEMRRNLRNSWSVTTSSPSA